MPIRQLLPVLPPLLTLLLALPLVAATQTLPPTITNVTTGAPIPYASLGVKNKPIGTVADGTGHFATEPLLGAAPTDTLVISCVGFQSRRMTVNELRQQQLIQLVPQAQVLTEVVVRGSGW